MHPFSGKDWISQSVISNLEFFFFKLEHEVLGKSVKVAPHGLIQSCGSHAIEFGQVAVEHDSLSADQVDPPFDNFGWNELVIGHRC